MAFRNDFFSFGVNYELHHFIQDFAECGEIFFIQVNLVFFVMKTSVVIRKLLTLSEREVVIASFGGPNVKKVGSSARS